MDAVVSAVPPGLQIVEISGPRLVSALLQWGLFGALALDLYYHAFPDDRLSTKCLVYTVYAIELVAMTLITHDVFAMFGYGFADVSVLGKIHLDWLDVPIMSGLVALIGQSFYAYRVYVLSKSWFVPVLIVILSLACNIGAFLAGAFILKAGDFALLNTANIFAAMGVWYGASALSDIVIAVSMTYYLSAQVTGFRQTRALVSKVIRLTIETGTLTALLAVTNLILFCRKNLDQLETSWNASQDAARSYGFKWLAAQR
ncbi:hypothetical protein FB451DRAFT_1403313 [Mycena latifolia]|nr:hypothetical protein FB451DRAFT_1403313 [Mycena latifolia]